MKLHFGLILLCGISLAAIGTAVMIGHRREPNAPTAAPAQIFQVKGMVRNIESDGTTVHIAHEDVPGFMPAMEMPFSVKEPSLLRGIESGDSVSFELVVTKDDSWITRIEKLSKNDELKQSEGVSSQPVAAGLLTGEQVPDFSLVDQNGNAFRLSEFRGKAVLLTFIYTRCPLPNFCPLMSKNFADLQERFAKGNLAGKVQLLSLSFDPEFDTPAVLRRYAELQQNKGTNWLFATGTTNQVNRVVGLFGLVRESANGLINHDLRTALIDPKGRLVHVWRSNVWTPFEVERAVKEVLADRFARH